MMWLLGIALLLVATFEPTLFFWGVVGVIAWQTVMKVRKGESLRDRGDLRVPNPGPRRDH